jgi:hypothetical protein
LFWFRLAKELGMSVARCQDEVSSSEFGEWIAYYSLEPFGDRLADLRMGTVASVLANVNRGKNSPVFKPHDFIPWAQQEKVVDLPQAEEVAALFGINLTELKSNGTKQIIIQRPKS